MPELQRLSEGQPPEHDDAHTGSIADGSKRLDHLPVDGTWEQGGDEGCHLLQGRHDESLQLRPGTRCKDGRYDGAAQRQMFHASQQSFDQQRDRYIEPSRDEHDELQTDPVQGCSHKMETGQDVTVQCDIMMRRKPSGIGPDASITPGLATMPGPTGIQEDIVRIQEKVEKVRREQERTSAGICGTGMGDTDIPREMKRRLNCDVPDVRIGEKGKGEYCRIVTGRAQVGRLKFEKRMTIRKGTEKEHDMIAHRAEKRASERRTTRRLIYARAGAAFDDDSTDEDDASRDPKAMPRRRARPAVLPARKNGRYLRRACKPYARLKDLKGREGLYFRKKARLQARYDRKVQREGQRTAASMRARRRMKKAIRRHHIENERNSMRRIASQLKMTKKSAAYKARTAKRALGTIGAMTGIVSVLLLSSAVLLPIIVGFIYGSSGYYSTAVIQAGYEDLTEATGYFRGLEADLDGHISGLTEEEIEEICGMDIYEIHHELAGFGFSANTLVAYLGARYGSFQLDSSIEAELQDIFQEMYMLEFEVKPEYREIEDTSITAGDGSHPMIQVQKNICYVKLTKKELEEVVEARLTDEQLDQYRTYRLSTGGQQIYGPVMREDWSGRISSNYGDRIHPITKERKTHKGVDIAVPTGTKLYSAVKGTVITAKYSPSAGNMVTIRNEAGWTVTFMHMDSLAVSNGQQIGKGDFVGCSGNTGNSTGPHLHLQVEDPGGNTVNPIFIIPQTCAMGEQG